MPDIPKVSSELFEELYGSGSMTVSPATVENMEHVVHTEIVSMFPSHIDGAIRSESVGSESRLSDEQLQELLGILQERFEQSNNCRPEGVTFADVQTILESDPDLAYQVYAAEVRLGAEMDYVVTKDGRNRFTDLRKETNVEQNVIFLRSIPEKEREAAIQSLRDQYPNIPANAFDRLPKDESGPNKWEGLLIERVLTLESIPEADYLALQAKLPREQWLDKGGISWLEASKEQLDRGDAPGGDRIGEGVHVYEYVAGNRYDVRGVRVRAKGLVN